MCLLVASTDATPLDLKCCERATKTNGDGFGIAYLSSDGSTVRIRKYLYVSPEDQHHLIGKAAARGPYLAHWRFSTSGGNKRELSHPFRLSRTCAIGHNGVLGFQDIPPGESDTSTLVGELRNLKVRDAQHAIEVIREIPAKYLGSSKFAALDSDGSIFIYNEEAGEYDGAVWHSNTCGLRGYRTDITYGSKWSQYYRGGVDDADDYYYSSTPTGLIKVAEKKPKKSLEKMTDAELEQFFADEEAAYRKSV